MTTLQWPLDVNHQCHMQSLHPAKLPLFQLQPNFDFETLFRDRNDGAMRLKQGHPLCLQTASVKRLGMGWGQDMTILQCPLDVYRLSLVPCTNPAKVLPFVFQVLARI